MLRNLFQKAQGWASGAATGGASRLMDAMSSPAMVARTQKMADWTATHPGTMGAAFGAGGGFLASGGSGWGALGGAALGGGLGKRKGYDVKKGGLIDKWSGSMSGMMKKQGFAAGDAVGQWNQRGPSKFNRVSFKPGFERSLTNWKRAGQGAIAGGAIGMGLGAAQGMGNTFGGQMNAAYGNAFSGMGNGTITGY